MENLLVLQSGGPTAVINASLAGVIKGGHESPQIGKVYGGLNGIEGVEGGRLVSLEPLSDGKSLRLLRQTPSSYLGSCRKKLPPASEDDRPYKAIFKVLEAFNIGCVCCIGGNDSMDTVQKLSRFAEETGKSVRFVGVPKTIDNDLCLTDHTPGFGSAAKFVVGCMRQLAQDTAVYDIPSVTVVEAMGRNAGWLAGSAALANDSACTAADIVCLPERPFDKAAFLARVEELCKTKKSVMLAVSEGIRGKDGSYIYQGEAAKANDKFGHASLGGAGKAVEALIKGELGVKTRSIELSTLQRCFSASASLCDVDEAFEAGCVAVRLALEGSSGIMVGFERTSQDPYRIKLVPLDVNLIANFEKRVPDEMIADDGFGVTEEFIRYALPLISGEPDLLYRDGRLQLAPPLKREPRL